MSGGAAHTLAGLPFGWGAIISTIGTVLGTAFGGGVLGVWLNRRHENRKVELDGDTQLRSEMWRDIEKLKGSKEETSRRLTVAETRISEQASELGQQRFLIGLMNNELERVSPGNSIAQQVRIMMDVLQSRATGSHGHEIGDMAETMSKMCFIPGTGEEQ